MSDPTGTTPAISNNNLMAENAKLNEVVAKSRLVQVKSGFRRGQPIWSANKLYAEGKLDEGDFSDFIYQWKVKLFAANNDNNTVRLVQLFEDGLEIHIGGIAVASMGEMEFDIDSEVEPVTMFLPLRAVGHHQVQLELQAVGRIAAPDMLQTPVKMVAVKFPPPMAYHLLDSFMDMKQVISKTERKKDIFYDVARIVNKEIRENEVEAGDDRRNLIYKILDAMRLLGMEETGPQLEHCVQQMIQFMRPLQFREFEPALISLAESLGPPALEKLQSNVQTGISGHFLSVRGKGKGASAKAPPAKAKTTRAKATPAKDKTPPK